jgi:hypothetical protein
MPFSQYRQGNNRIRKWAGHTAQVRKMIIAYKVSISTSMMQVFNGKADYPSAGQEIFGHIAFTRARQ